MPIEYFENFWEIFAILGQCDGAVQFFILFLWEWHSFLLCEKTRLSTLSSHIDNPIWEDNTDKRHWQRQCKIRCKTVLYYLSIDGIEGAYYRKALFSTNTLCSLAQEQAIHGTHQSALTSHNTITIHVLKIFTAVLRKLIKVYQFHWIRVNELIIIVFAQYYYSLL